MTVHQPIGTDTTISNLRSTAVAACPGWLALRVLPPASHGCIRVLLSLGRPIGAATGADVPRLALTAGTSSAATHRALLIAFTVCLVAGVPAAVRLGRGDESTR